MFADWEIRYFIIIKTLWVDNYYRYWRASVIRYQYCPTSHRLVKLLMPEDYSLYIQIIIIISHLRYG